MEDKLISLLSCVFPLLFCLCLFVCISLGATNFLIRVGDYLNLRIRTSAIGCLICDGPLGYRGVKPTVCPNALCNHRYT